MLHRSRFLLAIVVAIISAACTAAPPPAPAPPPPSAPEAQSLVETAAPAPATPAPPLTPDQRLALFDTMWKVVDQTYPYFGRRSVDWAAVRTTYQQAVLDARDDEAFRSILAQALAEVGDGHLRMEMEDASLSVRPPVNLQPSGNDLVVARVAPGTDAERQGIKPGMVVLQIDSLPATEAWHAAVARTSGSTPENRRHKAATRMLWGPAGSTFRLVAGFPGAEPVTATITRTAGVPPWYPEFEQKLLPGGVMYVRLTIMRGKQNLEAARAAFQEAGRRNPPGLIIDVRDNTGGEFGFEFGQDLMTRSSLLGYFSHNDTGRKDAVWAVPSGDEYTGPILVLTNGGCASYCDIFVTYMEQTERAQLVGAPPAGSAIMTGYQPLPHGYRLLVPMHQEVLAPDGLPIEGRSAKVAYPVVPTAADWATGRDPVLEKALELLGSMQK